MIRSNKENHVAFTVPRTPMGKGMDVSGPTKVNAKTPSAFVTPTANTRKPLGGKDTNTRFTTAKKAPLLTVSKPQGTATKKRTPLSGKLQSRNIQINETTTTVPAPKQELEVDEVESIPLRPPPMADLPLDHVEMDYDAIRKACFRPSNLQDKADSLSDIDRPIDELLDREYTLDTLLTASSQQQPSTRTGQSTQKRPGRRDFMAPTKSQQAKQRQITPKFTVARDNHPVTPQIDINVECDEIESALDF